MKIKEIKLPSPPKRWDDLSREQWKVILSLSGKYASEEAYLSKVFLLFCGLKPLLYAERWRVLFAKIPVVKRFIRMTGRQVIKVEENYIRWRQIYKMKDGTRFWMEDEEVMAFKESIRFVLDDPVVSQNPVSFIQIGRKKYYSRKRYLSDMEWMAYNTCSAYLNSWRRNKRDSDLYSFIAQIYRIEGKHVDKIRYTLTDTEIRLILLFWEGCHIYFAKKFKLLFKKAPDNKKNEKQVDFLIHESEVTAFLGKESFMKPDEVRDMYVIDAFTYLHQNAKEVEAKQKEIQKLKRKR